MQRAYWKYYIFTLLLLCLQLVITRPCYAQKYAKVDSFVRLSKTAEEDTIRIKALLHLAGIYRKDSIVQQYRYASEALLQSERIGWKPGRMYAEESVAECYSEVTMFREAIIHFTRCISLADDLGNDHMKRVCVQYLVHCYDHSGRKHKALEYQRYLVYLYSRTPNRHEECKQIWAYANLLIELGRHDEGIANMKKGIALAEASFKGAKKDTVVAEQLNNLGRMYTRVGKADSALLHLHRALKLAEGLNDTAQRAYITASISDVYYYVLSNYDSVLVYAGRAVKLGEQINDTWVLRHYYAGLGEAWEYKNNHQKALAYYKMADSLAKILDETQKTLDNAATVSQLSMQQQIKTTRLEKEAMEFSNRTQRFIVIISVCAVLILIVLVLFIYRSFRQESQANKIIGAQAQNLLHQNEVIDKALKEKEILLQETHHRVKNNLQLINSLLELQLADIDNEGTREALRAMQQRVHSIAMVHGRLYGEQGNTEVEFNAFVQDLFQSLYAAFALENANVKFVANVPQVYFSIGTLIPLGLILNELITNSFKHAFINGGHGIIQVDLLKRNDEYTLTYYDNGPGLSQSQFDAPGSSLGIYLVKRLSKQLKGKTVYQYNNGSIFTITFRHEGH